MLADMIMSRLLDGKDVAVVNLGDVSIYSTFSYMADIIRTFDFEVITVPGVTSFCAAAAALGVSLTSIDSQIHIIPNGDENVGEALKLQGTKIFMKTGMSMAGVRAEFDKRGIASKAMLVQNCGLSNEVVCRDMSKAGDDISYFTTIIVRE